MKGTTITTSHSHVVDEAAGICIDCGQRVSPSLLERVKALEESRMKDLEDGIRAFMKKFYPTKS